MRAAIAAGAITAAVALLGCGGSSHPAAARHASPLPATARSYADPLCGPVLREVPAQPPATNDEATAEFDAIKNLVPTSDAPLSRRVLRLETALNIIGLDLVANGSVTPADTARYGKYVTSLHQFCEGI